MFQPRHAQKRHISTSCYCHQNKKQHNMSSIEKLSVYNCSLSHRLPLKKSIHKANFLLVLLRMFMSGENHKRLKRSGNSKGNESKRKYGSLCVESVIYVSQSSIKGYSLDISLSVGQIYYIRRAKRKKFL